MIDQIEFADVIIVNKVGIFFFGHLYVGLGFSTLPQQKQSTTSASWVWLTIFIDRYG